MPRPQETRINQPSDAAGSELERRVFRSLFNNRKSLGLSEIVQCSGIHADGWIYSTNHGQIPIEIKTTLGWPQLTSASFQLVSIKNKLKMTSKEAWIIYTKVSTEWGNRKTRKNLDHANDCITDFRVGLDIKFILFDSENNFTITGGTSAA